ncbi:MAG: SDR family oxidoreductase [Hyphomicrobiaceae bacterium]|nr:SDR family oxidoreductase [Hyphomicrobiaceae bacterium]
MTDKRVALVTGANRGMGLEIVRQLSRLGLIAVLAARDLEKGKVAAATLAAEEFDVPVVALDVTDEDSIRAAVAEVRGLFGRIDVLVNNAGIIRDAQLVKWKEGEVVSRMSDEAWDAVIGVNLKGVFNCTRAVVPRMIAGGGGAILNASSVAGLNGNFGQTNYVATKAGVIGMTQTWARELGRYKIRVNAVAPGFVRTEILGTMPQKVIDGMVAHTPMGRIGDVKDIAEAYLWLASDAATWVSGATLSVDGGLVIGT